MILFSTHPLHPEATARLASLGDYRVASAPTGAAIMAEGLEADILIVRAPIPPAYFTANPSLRAVVRHGAGLDMVPMDAAAAAGVIVSNVPGANAATVAEFAIFAAIAVLRQFRQMDAALRAEGWAAARRFADTGRELGGRRLGILGYGNIGRNLGPLGSAFGMRVAAHTRRPETLPKGVEALSLDALAATSDVLVVCCPLTDETRGAISAARIASMNEGAVLVNVARGPIVDTGALLTALQSGRIGAALDVFDAQPLDPASLLFALPNVVLTPHASGITEDSMARMGAVVADEVARIVAGGLPVNLCNPEVLPAWRVRFPG